MNLAEMIVGMVKLGFTLLQVVKKLRDDGYTIPYLEIKKYYLEATKNKKGGK